jgi:hypothetical protein
MSQAKDASKRKRRRKVVPVLGAAGALSLAGGAAYAATSAPTADLPSKSTVSPHQMVLGEEEVADVSLSKFFVFDKENGKAQLGEQVAWRGCGRCGGCRGCRGCGRGCGWRGCGCGVGWGCCASWGRCGWC